MIYIAFYNVLNIPVASAVNLLTHSNTCWSCYWTTCHNVWWGRTGAGCTVVGTRVRGSHARTEEDTRPVHLSSSCYIGNCGSTAVAWDASRRSSPGVGHCHWGVYLRVQLCDAGEVEASGGIDISEWGACDVYPRRRNWGRKEQTTVLFNLETYYSWSSCVCNFCDKIR